MKALRAISAVFGLAIAVTLFAFWAVRFSPRKYYVSTNAGFPSIYYSKTDVLIVETRSTIASGRITWFHPKSPLWRLVLRNQQASVSSKTIVTHYVKGALNTQEFEGYYFLFGDEKDLFLEKYLKNSKEKWRFNGTTFDREKDVALQDSADDDASYDDDEAPLPKASPWKFAKVYNADKKEKLVHMDVAGEDLTVLVPAREAVTTYPDFPAPKKFVFNSPSLSTPLVIGDVPAPREISRAEFESMTAGKLSGETGATLNRLAIVQLLAYFGFPLALFVWKLWPVLTIKSKMMAQHTDQLSFPPATMEQFSGLDRDKLQSTTQAFEQLGFKVLADHSIAKNSGVQIPVFARLMVNERENCFAEVGQVMPPNRKPIFMSSVQSILTDHWTLGTSSSKPQPLTVLWRRQRAVSKSMIGASPSELFTDHLAMRSQMIADLGISVQKSLSADAWYASSRVSALERREALDRHLAIFMWPNILLCRFRVKKEWRGEWPKVAAQRTIQPMAFTAGR